MSTKNNKRGATPKDESATAGKTVAKKAAKKAVKKATPKQEAPSGTPLVDVPDVVSPTVESVPEATSETPTGPLPLTGNPADVVVEPEEASTSEEPTEDAAPDEEPSTDETTDSTLKPADEKKAKKAQPSKRPSAVGRSAIPSGLQTRAGYLLG